MIIKFNESMSNITFTINMVSNTSDSDYNLSMANMTSNGSNVMLDSLGCGWELDKDEIKTVKTYR